MNEDLLLEIFKGLKLDQKGNFEDFKSDMQDLDFAESFFNNSGLSKKGKFEDFKLDIYGQAEPPKKSPAQPFLGFAGLPTYGQVREQQKQEAKKGREAAAAKKPAPTTTPSTDMEYGDGAGALMPGYEVDRFQPILGLDPTKVRIPEGGGIPIRKKSDPPVKDEEIGAFDGFLNAIDRGINQGRIADLLALGSTPSKEDLKEIARIQRENQNIKPSKAYEDFNNAESLSHALRIFIQDPFEITSQLATESLAAQIRHGYNRALAGAGTGAAMGSIVPGIGTTVGAGTGYIAGMGMAGYNLEVASSVLESLQEQGVDITDEQSLIDGFNDKEKMEKARSFAFNRGVPIAIFDMISGGLAGKIFSKPAKSVVGRALQGAGEVTIQAGLGGAGEAAGQVISGQKINPTAILAEALGEIGGSSPDIVVGTIVEAKKSNDKAAQKKTMINSTVPVEQFDEMVEISEGAGEITELQADELKEEYKKIQSSKESMPEDFRNNDEIYDLLEQKKQLENQKGSSDKVFESYYDSKINDISNKINTAIQNLTPTRVEVGGNVLGTFNNGEKVVIEDNTYTFDRNSLSFLPTKEELTPITADDIVSQNLQIIQQPKTTEDAVQKQEAGQVPLQPGARGGQEVVQEVQAEPQVTTREGEAEAGAKAKEEVTSKEFKNFVDKNQVSPERIDSIANKVINQQTLSPREQQIFTSKTTEVNNRIKQIAEEQKQAPAESVEGQKADIERRRQGKDNKIENITYNNGVYEGSFLDDYEFIAEGSESRVYRSKDGTHVIKISEPYNSKDENLFNARITNNLLREIIGNSGLEVIGYYEHNGVKNPIYKQNFVEGKTLSEKEVVDYLKTIKGIVEIDGEFYYKYDGKLYAISDFSDNVIQDKEGNIIPIDLDIYEVSDSKINAKYDAELAALGQAPQATKAAEPTPTPTTTEKVAPKAPQGPQIEFLEGFQTTRKDGTMSEPANFRKNEKGNWVRVSDSGKSLPVPPQIIPQLDAELARITPVQAAPVVAQLPPLKPTAKEAKINGTQYTLAEDLPIFKGTKGKRNIDGSLRTVHPDVQGSFVSASEKVADRYKGDGSVISITLPAGTTVETVSLEMGDTPASQFRQLETDAINNSDADIVRLETIDATGLETQYIIKNPALRDQLRQQGDLETPVTEEGGRKKAEKPTAEEAMAEARGAKVALTPELAPAIEAVSNFLKSAGVRVNVLSDAEFKEFAKSRGDMSGDEDGVFISDNNTGEIYINEAKVQNEWGRTIVFHEGIHPVMNIIKNTNPDLYANVLKGIRDEAKRNDGVAQAIAEVEASPGYQDKGQDVIDDEIIVETLARIADGKINLSKVKPTFKSRIIEFMNNIATKLGLPKIKADSSDKQFRDFATKLSTALQEGGSIEDIVGIENVTEFENKIEQLKVIPNNVFQPTNIQQYSNIPRDIFGDKIIYNEDGQGYELSNVKESDLIDFEQFVKKVSDEGSNVWFWMADQLGIGVYSDQYIDVKTGDKVDRVHYLDAGPSFALDPENRKNKVIWASGGSGLNGLLKDTDYIFIVSGHPQKAKLFNKTVVKALADRIDASARGWKSFRKNVLENSKISAINKLMTRFDSIDNLINSTGPGRKDLFLELNKVLTSQKKTDLANYLRDINVSFDVDNMRDGFYKKHNFNINDVMLVLKPTGLGGKAKHSTYEKEILGEVIGVPDRVVNGISLLPKESRDKYTSYLQPMGGPAGSKKSVLAPPTAQLSEGIQRASLLNEVDSKSFKENVSSVITDVKSTPANEGSGATFNIDGTPYTGKGLVIPTFSLNTTQDELTNDLLYKFADDNRLKLTEQQNKLGVYKFEDQDTVSLDVSVIVPKENLEVAKEFARLAGQQSIYDLEAGVLIETGQTGANPINFTDEESVEISNALLNNKLPESLKNYEKEIQPKPGNRIFNEPLEDASTIAIRYAEKAGIQYQDPEKITKLDKNKAKRISDAFDEMESNPSDPEVKRAYSAMAKETLDQYEEIVKSGYKVEINNNEPYANSQEMIDDLRNNKRMKIFSTESGFGNEPITDKQRKDNPLLRNSGFKDVNGNTLLVNDIFRFVHDFFGHAKLGNGFGPVGEENAWNVHARMYTPLARRAMTTETRGQNSWVNFSGVNDEVFKTRDEARKLREQGRIDEAEALVADVYDKMMFAEQKIGLLPEEFSTPEGSVQKSAIIRPPLKPDLFEGRPRFMGPSVEPVSGQENLVEMFKEFDKHMTDDGEGNYVFYHITSLDLSNDFIDPLYFGRSLNTSRDESPGVGISMYYTDPLVADVTGDFTHVVKIPKNMVYPFQVDPLNFYDLALERFRQTYPYTSFDANKQVGFISQIASENGYPMTVALWDKIPLRAQTTIKIKPHLLRKGSEVYMPEIAALRAGINTNIPSQTEIDNNTAIVDNSLNNLKDSASDILPTQASQVQRGQFKGEIKFNPKNRGSFEVKSFNRFIDSLTDYIRAKVDTGVYTQQDFIAEMESGVLGAPVIIDQVGADFLFNKANVVLDRGAPATMETATEDALKDNGLNDKFIEAMGGIDGLLDYMQNKKIGKKDCK